jgi:hypothetical protein
MVARLAGSAVAKARLGALLRTLTGRQTAAEACLLLGLTERRLYALRRRMLQAALAGLEPHPMGRPPRPPLGLDARVRALEAELHDVRLDLHAAQVREEIALVLPQLVARAARAKRAARRRAAAPRDAPVACGASHRRPCGPGAASPAGRPASGRPARPNAPSAAGRSHMPAGPRPGGCRCPRRRPGWASRPGR